jgi:hypothetical protein
LPQTGPRAYLVGVVHPDTIVAARPGRSGDPMSDTEGRGATWVDSNDWRTGSSR